MQKGDYLTTILKSTKTVLTLKDIVLLWQDSNTDAVRVRLSYYVKKGDLYRIRRGLYAKGKEYNKLELATRIFTPSYVSFETVLAQKGLIFQYQSSITVASYLTRDIIIEGQTYSYKKIKDKVLINTSGIEHSNETSCADKERAFLDMLYINTDYHYDNIRSLNWDKVFVILPIYTNTRMTKTVEKLFEQSKTNK
jgi:predicted transcriptional regulator of viral defense system